MSPHGDLARMAGVEGARVARDRLLSIIRTAKQNGITREVVLATVRRSLGTSDATPAEAAAADADWQSAIAEVYDA